MSQENQGQEKEEQGNQEDDSAITQDDSGFLRAGRVIQFANQRDKSVSAVGWPEYNKWTQERGHRFGVSSEDELRELKSDIISEVYPLEDIRDMYKRFYDGGESVDVDNVEVGDDPDGHLNQKTEPRSRGSSANSGNRSGKQFKKFVGRSYHRARKVRQRGEQLPIECFESLCRAHREQVWPDDIQKSPTWNGNDDVDQETGQWVKSIIELEDPMWDEYENVPMAAGLTVKNAIKNSLNQPQGWSLSSIADRLQKDFPQMEQFQVERIARQEVAGVLNRSKIASLLARPGDPLVKWVGPGDKDSTELCKSLEEETSDGVPISEMMDLLKEYSRQHEGGTPDRAEQGLPHWQCRYTVEIVEDE